jgi:hypothetical protein
MHLCDALNNTRFYPNPKKTEPRKQQQPIILKKPKPRKQKNINPQKTEHPIIQVKPNQTTVLNSVKT